MDGELEIIGPRTKAAIALFERKRRALPHASRPPQPRPEFTPPPNPIRTSTAPCGRAAHGVVSSISAVCEQLGLSLRTVRYYEEIGLIACGRGERNSRTLDQDAKSRLREVIELKKIGFSLREIINIIEYNASTSECFMPILESKMQILDRRRTALEVYLCRISTN